MKSNTEALRAIAWALGAAFVFTLVFASAKFVGSQADPIQIVFMRYLGAAIVVTFIVVVWQGGLSAQKSPNPGLHVARAACGVFGEICIISAPLFIAYEDATAIGLTNGVIAIILAIVLLKEAARPMHWIASATCLAGAMLIARADSGSATSGTPAFGLGLAVFGALLSGSELFLIKLLSGRERPIAIMLYVNILAILMLLIPALWVWNPISGWDLLWLVLLGPLALFGQLCWIRAFQYGDAVLVVPIGYAAIPFAALLGAIAFDQSVGLREMAGALLVIAGGVVLARLPVRQP
ncbi:MAG: DMT family transporter [Alphaproteobacteria bacterium]|nr:DMT family transporter [Alphaproteobacteria bacterium]